MGADGKPVLMKQAKVEFIDDGPGKPVGINRFIGRRPILAFGNSDGDQQMPEWTAAGVGPSFLGLVRHTDAGRVGEVRYDRFGVFTDFIFLGLDSNDEVTKGPVAVAADLELDTIVWTFGASYRAIESDRGSLGLLVGGRLWNVDARGSLVGPLAVRQRSGSKTWVDRSSASTAGSSWARASRCRPRATSGLRRRFRPRLAGDRHAAVRDRPVDHAGGRLPLPRRRFRRWRLPL
jgi:hypothetical protein